MILSPYRATSYRPSVIIALGEIGAAVCAELIEYRQRIRAFRRAQPGVEDDRFDVVLLRARESRYRQLNAVSDGDPLEPHFPEMQGSTSELRQSFLNQTMTRAAEDIREAAMASLAHRRQVEAQAVKPVICVVGATWEPYGAAMFWPVAYLVRKLFGPEIPYTLVGLPLTANYLQRPDHQRLGDALTFVTLEEADAALNGRPLTWRQRIDEAYPRRENPPKALYDQLFMLDSLKHNGTTTPATDDSLDVRRSMAMVLEAIVRTDLIDCVDAFLLDDFAISQPLSAGTNGAFQLGAEPLEEQEVRSSDELKGDADGRYSTPDGGADGAAQQSSSPLDALPSMNEDQERLTYTGIGVSSLVVPLRELFERLLNHSTVSAINGYLLAKPEPGEVGATESRQLLADVWRSAGERFERAAQDEARVLRQQPPLRTNAGLALRFDVRMQRVDVLAPTVTGVRISGDDPFSFEGGTSVAQVLERVEAEISARSRVQRRILAAIDVEGRQFDQEMREGHQAAALRLLRVGDPGLGQAIEMLQASAQTLRDRAIELERTAARIATSDELARLRDAFGGDRRWYYNQRRLRPIIESRSRTTSLVLRGLVLFCIAYQFYYDGWARDIFYFPFRILELIPNPTITGILLPLLLAVMIAAALIFLAGLPILGARWALYAHRQALGRLLQLELDQQICQHQAERLRAQAAELDRRREPLSTLNAGLRRRAEALTELLGRPPLPAGDYLEHAPVSAKDMETDGQKQEILNRALAANRGRMLASWLESPGDDPWRVLSADKIVEQLRTAFSRVLDHVVVHPVESYLQPGSHSDWAYRLWRSSVPWIRSNGSQSGGEPEALLSAVITWPAHGNGLAQAARDQVTRFLLLPSNDPYRTVFVQLVAGIRSTSWARREQCAQAFREQSPAVRQRLTEETGVFAGFPPVITPVSAEPAGFGASAAPSANGGRNSQSSPTPDDWPSVNLTPMADNLHHVLAHLMPVIHPMRIKGELDEASETAVENAVRKLEAQIVNTASAREDFALLAQLLPQLQSSLDALPAHVQPMIASHRRQISLFIQGCSLEAVAPTPGEPYQPDLHGADVQYQQSATTPPGEIIAVLRIGYRQLPEGRLLSPPSLVVSVQPDTPPPAAPAEPVPETGDQQAGGDGGRPEMQEGDAL